MVDHPNAILSDKLAVGYTSGPEFLTSTVSLSSGYEVRNARRAQPRWRFNFSIAEGHADGIRQMLDFYMGRRGRLYSWLLKDPWDYQLIDESILVAAGGETTAQIKKTYNVGGPAPITRTIRYIASGTLKVYVNGVLDSGATQTNGLVTLSSPLTIGQVVTIGSNASPTEYYFPVRFLNDFAGLQMSSQSANYGSIQSFDAIEVLEPAIIVPPQQESVGAAFGTSAASAVGASVAASVGAAAGTSSVGGVSQQPGDAVGSAQGTSTVSAVGASTVAATAIAAGSGAASGVGASTAAATGSAAGTATASGVATSPTATLTIASGTVASNLSAFPVYVDLSDMPSGFWSEAEADGGNIRVYQSDGVTQIPFDLVHIDTVNSVGKLFFKADLLAASNNVFKITCGVTSLNLLPPTDTYGRNNVWSDYHRVYVFPSGDDRTGSGESAKVAGATTSPYEFSLYATSPNLAVHQGCTWDGTHYYAVDDNKIKKYDASWNLIATNSDPIGASGIGGGVNHCGDPEVLEGVLYIPIELYPNSPYNNQHIALFDTATLSFISSYNISANAHEASSIAYNPDDGLFYICDYTVAGAVHKYDPNSSFAYVGALTLDDGQIRQQGITFFRGRMYVSIDPSTGAKIIRRYTSAGRYEGLAYSTSGANSEGLNHNDDGLLWFKSDTSSVGNLLEIHADPMTGQVGWLNLNAAGQAKANVSRFTTWTMGASFVPQNFTANNAILSYTQDETANTSRATLALRDGTPDQFGIWNSTDTWLMDSVTPSAGVEYRLNHTQATTASRKIYRNGVAATDTTVVQKPSGASATVLYIGAEDLSLNERATGSINYVYLRNGELSADWIAAEDKSWRTPASFYTVS